MYMSMGGATEIEIGNVSESIFLSRDDDSAGCCCDKVKRK
jgi:hypothetical protein